MMRLLRIALLLLSLGMVGAVNTGIMSISPGIGYCSEVAQDAFNFDVFAFCGASCFIFDNQGQKTTSGFACGYETGPVCPAHLPTGGIEGTGAVDIDSGLFAEWVPVGLDFDDKPWHNYSTANEVTISFHIKATNIPGVTAYGWWRSPIIWTTGEIFTGVDNNGGVAPHGDRVCINVDTVEDKGGSVGIRSVYCGSDADAVNNGLGPTTGAGSITVGDWHHVVMVWDGTDGEYRVYFNQVLVHTETGITGTIPNTTNKWTIGVGDLNVAFTHYELDNLQIDNVAWDLPRVIKANCNIPTINPI